MDSIQILIVTIILSGFFSGIELAFVSSNKLQIELERKKGSLSGKILSRFIKNQSRFLGTTLIGNNIALIIFSLSMSLLLEPFIIELVPASISGDFTSLLLITLITTFVVLFFGEFLPKILFRLNPNSILSFFALPIWFVYYLLYPLVEIMVALSKFLLNYVFRLNYTDAAPVFNKYDLEHIIKNPYLNKQNGDEDIKTTIFEKALFLIEVKVRECMIPRPEVIALEVKSSIQELKKTFIRNKVSRIIIYDTNIDNIVGYVHHFELLKKPEQITDIIFPIPVIPESMPARDLLSRFIKDQKSIAWVIDEYGGTAGIVTIEDVLEEIFGEIRDEYDHDEFIEKQISETEYIFSGRMEIDYVNEKYNLNLPDEDFETLSGLVVSGHESIPDMNEVIEIDGFEFTVLNVSEKRIETLKIKILEKQ
ncbi:MAG: HlyC/CorC family transporter [Chitinophagaceae bacterium]|nr:MAG: HlyC/CorC family transporter [Chitinophagaceae bacterium]